MQLFYTTHIEDDLAQLTTEEARHCVQVLRKRVGDSLDLVDGKGFFYKGEIVETSKKNCVVKILKRRAAKHQRPYLKMAIAPTKNIDRLEWFLEKATEIGIDEIVPLLCARSERKRIRPDRLEKILVAAMKQSLKAELPTLRELTKFKDFLQQEQLVDCKLIAYCNTEGLRSLPTILEKGKSALMLIGPEGDFSPEEIEQALAAGFEGLSLGPNRLRTETAGVVACTIFNMLNE